ncbi:TPA: hypothetical protein ACJYKC_002126 [Neisseria gonorrhoeae]
MAGKLRHSRESGNLGLSARKLIGKKGFSGPESWIPTFVGMTGFNDAAGNDKIDTKHLPSTCRDKSSAGCIETPRADLKCFPRKRSFLKNKKIPHPTHPILTRKFKNLKFRPNQHTRYPMPIKK